MAGAFAEPELMLERALITANSIISISGSFLGETRNGLAQTEEIELSAFLRMLGTRDAYRRIYQARTEPAHVLELLWQHPEAPRSVRLCLARCRHLLQLSSGLDVEGGAGTLRAVDDILHRLVRTDWSDMVPGLGPEDDPNDPAGERERREPTADLRKVQGELLGSLLSLHTLISDGFFSHQSRIGGAAQPMLKGF